MNANPCSSSSSAPVGSLDWVVTGRGHGQSIFRGAIALTAALGVVAALFALLGADFVAAGQLLIYVAALSSSCSSSLCSRKSRATNSINKPTTNGSGGAFCTRRDGRLDRSVPRGLPRCHHNRGVDPDHRRDWPSALGEMVVPFEAVSLVLLAALVGAVYFGLDRRNHDPFDSRIALAQDHGERSRTMTLSLHHFLMLSAILFGIGIYGVLSRRNVLGLLMSIELMFNATNINLVAFNHYLYPDRPWGQGWSFCDHAGRRRSGGRPLIGLVIFRNIKSVYTEKLNILHG